MNQRPVPPTPFNPSPVASDTTTANSIHPLADSHAESSTVSLLKPTELDAVLTDTHTTRVLHSVPNQPSVNPPLDKVMTADTPMVVYDDTESLSLGRRLFNAILVAGVYGVVGVVIDWLINLAKLFGGNSSAEIVWLFLPILAVMGLIFGALWGTKALDVLFGLFRTTPATVNPNNDDSSFSAGIMRAAGFGLLIGIVGWLAMMMLA